MHYSSGEIERAIKAALKSVDALRPTDALHSRELRLQRKLAPVFLRFQMEEANRGTPMPEIVGAVSEALGHWSERSRTTSLSSCT